MRVLAEILAALPVPSPSTYARVRPLAQSPRRHHRGHSQRSPAYEQARSRIRTLTVRPPLLHPDSPTRSPSAADLWAPRAGLVEPASRPDPCATTSTRHDALRCHRPYGRPAD